MIQKISFSKYNLLGLFLIFLSLGLAASVSEKDVLREVYKQGFRYMAWYTEMDSNGNLYVTGAASSLDKTKPEAHWIIKKSEDQGETWKDLPLPGSTFLYARAFSVSVNSLGHIIAVAEVKDDLAKPSHPEIRWSTDEGQTWVSLPDQPLAEGKKSAFFHAKVLEDDTILLFGQAYDKDGYAHWIIKRREINQQSWETVDDVVSKFPNPPEAPYEGPHDSTASPVAYNSRTGELYAAGWWDDADGHPVWTVRKSVDLGKADSWFTVDLYKGSYKNGIGLPYQIFFDDQDNVYVLGNVADLDDPTFLTSSCILRKMDATTQEWSDLKIISDKKSCAFIGGVALKDSIYLTYLEAEMVDKRFTPSSGVLRSLDGGQTWSDQITAGKGPYDQGSQLNGIRFNNMGELIVTGSYTHRPAPQDPVDPLKPVGDEMVIKKVSP